jgi:hypothetical protein
MELFFGLLAAVAVFFTIAGFLFLALEWISKKLMPLVKNVLKQNKNNTMISGVDWIPTNDTNNPQAREALITHYVNAVDDATSYKVDSYRMYHQVQPTLEQLQKIFTIKVVNEYCDWTNKNCMSIVQLIGETGIPIFMSYRRMETDNTFEDKAVYSNANGPIEGPFIIGADTEIVYGANLTDMSDVKALKQIIEENKVGYIDYPKKQTQEQHSFQRLAYSKGNGYYFQTVYANVNHNFPIDLLYNKVELEFAGEKHKIDTSVAVPIFGSLLESGRSIAIFGKPGVGKTRLMDIVANNLYHESKSPIQVIQITPGMIDALQTPELQGFLVDSLGQRDDKGNFYYRNVFLIDEAESSLKSAADGIHTRDNSLLLQLMDGEIGRSINASVICTFNAKPTELNSALFRKNRISAVVELLPLDEASARKLVRLIRQDSPELVLDQKQFESSLMGVNADTKGIVYAKAGEITLADVFATFAPRDVHMALLESIRIAAGLNPSTGQPKPVVRKILLQKMPAAKEHAASAMSGHTAPGHSMPAEANPVSAPTKRARFNPKRRK